MIIENKVLSIEKEVISNGRRRTLCAARRMGNQMVAQTSI